MAECPNCGGDHEEVRQLTGEEAVALLKAGKFPGGERLAGYSPETMAMAELLISTGMVRVGQGVETGQLFFKSQSGVEEFIRGRMIEAVMRGTGQGLN